MTIIKRHDLDARSENPRKAARPKFGRREDSVQEHNLADTTILPRGQKPFFRSFGDSAAEIFDLTIQEIFDSESDSLSGFSAPRNERSRICYSRKRQSRDDFTPVNSIGK